MYAVGTSHLAELAAVTAESGAGRQLFVNYPDRYVPNTLDGRFALLWAGARVPAADNRDDAFAAGQLP